MGRVFLLACTALLLSVCLAGAQQPEGDPTKDLHRLLAEITAAARGGHGSQFEQMLEGLLLADPQAFFPLVFGEQEGIKLAANYSGQKTWLKERTAETLREMAKADPAKLEIKIEQHEEPEGSGLNDFWQAVLRQRRSGAPMLSASYRVSGGSWHALAEFFHTGVGFGVVNNQTFTGLPGVPPMRLRVGGNVMSQKLRHRPTPQYPEGARLARIQGTVRLSVVIGTEGTVKEIETVSGPKELREAANEAVRRWQYEVTKLNGVPVEVLTTIDVQFSLLPRL